MSLDAATEVFLMIIWLEVTGFPMTVSAKAGKMFMVRARDLDPDGHRKNVNGME